MGALKGTAAISEASRWARRHFWGGSRRVARLDRVPLGPTFPLQRIPPPWELLQGRPVAWACLTGSTPLHHEALLLPWNC